MTGKELGKTLRETWPAWAVLIIASAVDVGAEFNRVSAMHLGDVVHPFELGLVGENTVADVTLPPSSSPRAAAEVAPLVGNLWDEITSIGGAVGKSRQAGLLKGHAPEIESQGFLAQLARVRV